MKFLNNFIVLEPCDDQNIIEVECLLTGEPPGRCSLPVVVDSTDKIEFYVLDGKGNRENLYRDKDYNVYGTNFYLLRPVFSYILRGTIKKIVGIVILWKG